MANKFVHIDIHTQAKHPPRCFHNYLIWPIRGPSYVLICLLVNSCNHFHLLYYTLIHTYGNILYPPFIRINLIFVPSLFHKLSSSYNSPVYYAPFFQNLVSRSMMPSFFLALSPPSSFCLKSLSIVQIDRATRVNITTVYNT